MVDSSQSSQVSPEGTLERAKNAPSPPPMQLPLFHEATYGACGYRKSIKPFKTQLLKWVGNKQRFAHEIISYFPAEFGKYREPFLGSGAVLATLSPPNAVGSDSFEPLIEIFQTLRRSPETLKRWYGERLRRTTSQNKREVYEAIKASYNASPNPADFLFISRSCYGGVVRFRKADGYISTPVGAHRPISMASFSRRVDEWHRRTTGAEFEHLDYEEAMAMAESGDMVYCDPPYSYSQSILYGAQSFILEDLFSAIAACKDRGAFVALSIDGTKRSDRLHCSLPIPEGLFVREVFVHVGRSMLKRFQMNGRSLEGEVVSDRLLLTY